jgi:hypothetical protein
MCNLYSITTNQAAIIALSSTATSAPAADAGGIPRLSGSRHLQYRKGDCTGEDALGSRRFSDNQHPQYGVAALANHAA